MSKIKTNQLAHTSNGAAVYTLPQTDGSAGQVLQTDGSGNLSWVTRATTSGITMVDEWRVNGVFSGTSTDVSSNWERNDTQFSQIGTGMTESSGIFTFPSTGIYLVQFTANAYITGSGDSRYVGCSIYGTSDNANYNRRSTSYDSAYDRNANIASSSTTQCIFDCTNTSNDKVKFKIESEITATFEVSTDDNRTFATFIRLGDT